MSPHSSIRDRRSAASRLPAAASVLAFTLLELLAAVAIVGVLAALVFTVGTRTLDNAKKVECVSHLSTLGKAFQLYMADNGLFPQKNPSGQPQDWITLFKPYLGGDKEVYRCPVPRLVNGKPVEFRSTSDTNLVTNYGISYWLAEGLATGGGGAQAGRRPSPVSINNMSKVGVLVDARNNWLKETQPDRVWAGHGDQANVMFFDGHVESLTLRQLQGPDGKLSAFGYPGP